MDKTRLCDADMNRLFDAALADTLSDIPESEANSLLFLSGVREGQRLELPAQGTLRFGRAPSCEVVFSSDDAPMISAKHAELSMSEREVSLVDPGSTNGTYVNGQRIRESRVLNDHDMLEFGHPGVRAVFLAGRVVPKTET